MFVFQGLSSAEPGDMRNISSMELVKDMGIGWNLGNTLEACGDWIHGSSVSSYERAWGNPVTTKEMIDGIEKAGFDSVRIPVAWSNLMDDNYTISPDLMNRVEEVVNYVLDNDMYVVVNIHWDGGWIHNASTDYDETLKKYKAIWTQVSEHFRDYSDYLIFESMNEEGAFNDIWNRWSGEGNKSRAYAILNNINQEFVDVVRASGGNNAKRHLLIAGYATDIDLTIDEAFKLPEDPENRLAVSVHYYTPSTFTILEEDADWGKAAREWGTEAEIEQIREDMEKAKIRYIDKGVPVILGEFG
ncbi:MAG: glycoside hydrolase family 5 protein, partial [Halanaerobiales bacterium]